MCREKYGNSAGYLQEQEGPALVKDFLKNYSLDEVRNMFDSITFTDKQLDDSKLLHV